MRIDNIPFSAKPAPKAKFKKRMVALVGVTTVGLATAATAVETFKYQMRGNGADLGTTFTSPDGCENVDIYLFVGETVVKDGPGAPTAGPAGTLSVSKYNSCTNTGEWGWGEVSLQSFSITNNLTAASAVGSSQVMFCNETDACYTEAYNFDVDWTGTGTVNRFSSNNRYVFGGIRTQSRFKGSQREATITGTISSASTTYTLPGEWTWATIGSYQSGETTIIKQ